MVTATFAGLLILMLLTREQARTWHDSLTLWNHALSVNGKNYFAHYNLGMLRRDEGKIDPARRHLAEAAALYPEFVPARYHLGELCLRRGQFVEAEGHLAFVVRKQPFLALAHNQLGAALTRQGRLDEGMGHFREAQRLNPADPDAHNNLGMAYGMQGHLRKARQFGSHALSTPNTPKPTTIWA